MANAGATATGLKELRDAIEQLPETVTASLRLVAANTAHRIQERAKALLRSQLKSSATALVDGIVVLDEPEKHRYVVDSTRPPEQPTNLPDWIERGTRFMSARSYMRPAGDAEEERYHAESMAAAEAAVKPLGKL